MRLSKKLKSTKNPFVINGRPHVSYFLSRESSTKEIVCIISNNMTTPEYIFFQYEPKLFLRANQVREIWT